MRLADIQCEPTALPNFDLIARQWIEVIDAYTAEHLDKRGKAFDVPYYYNERANLSLLAAAAWKSGYVALEEYTCYKGRDDAAKNGRSDLYLKSGDLAYVLEAKHRWMGTRSDFEKTITSGLEDARADSRNSPNDGKKVALCFVVLKVSSHDMSDYLDGPAEFLSRHIETFVTACRVGQNGSRAADLVAWCFPEAARLLKAGDPERFFPGVFLVARRFRRDGRAPST